MNKLTSSGGKERSRRLVITEKLKRPSEAKSPGFNGLEGLSGLVPVESKR